jgi:REP element-mobilizing transposase RayT
MQRVYEYRRHLPHYQGDYKAIFLTFSNHHRWILPPEARTIALESCTWGNGTRLNLHGAVVMPDHVHVIFTPLYDGDSLYSVAEITQGIKTLPHTRSIACGIVAGRFGSVNRSIEFSVARRAFTRRWST